MRALNIPKYKLYQMYVKQKMTTKKISNVFKCDRSTILKYLHKYNIPTQRPVNRTKIKTRSGYIKVFHPKHSFASENGYVYEHRLVMEQQIGRYLTPEEIVHHINEIKNDNRIENLKLFKNRSEHKTYHMKQLYIKFKELQEEISKIRDIKIFVKKLDKNARVPHKKHINDAGYDLYATQQCVVPARGIAEVYTGICLELPEMYYAEIHSRSGLRRKGIFPPVGIIDQNYRGDLRVILFNYTNKDYVISKGDRVAQIIIKLQVQALFKGVNKLSNSDRGKNGFGSTGK